MSTRKDRFLITSSQLPAGPEEKTAVLRNLSGGLNLSELDYRMDADQSPDMQNLWWRDGVLGCRDGQEFLSRQELGTGLCAYERLFWGRCVVHIGDGLYEAEPGTGMELRKLCGGLEPVRGTFLRYRGALLYKTKGAFKQITWDGAELQAKDVQAYVPVTLINATADGAGDLYQPENRLSPRKTVWYTAARQTRGVSFTATGTATQFQYATADGEPVASVEQVYVGTTLIDPTQYTLSQDKCTVTFQTAPEKDAAVSVVYTVGVRTYQLPEQNVDAVVSVTVDGEPVTAFTADCEAGTVTFDSAPPVQDPPQNNTVRITYEKADPDAYASIMDCRYGATYGGTGGAVLILAGSEAQPNAYFWNGSHVAMDPGYFPISAYNLAGDNLEPVTGFGQQAGYLVVFKEHSVGRCLLSTTTVGDRAHLSLDYTPVNAVLGCDLPWTIRLAENNLVWCNTYAGACMLADTTAALENQVLCLSRSVNGGDSRPGLLDAVRSAATVCALEDGERYWIAAGGQAFVWDHGLSSPQRPSWFRFTNIPAVDFFRGDSLPRDWEQALPYTGPRRIFHLDEKGRVSCFARTFRDYGGPIEKVYQFATQSFGTYERRKNIKKIVIATRSDTDTVLTVRYDTDQEQRRDLTPITSFSWKLRPRDLSKRYLGLQRFAHVAVRKPGCRHVQHFSLRLENAEAGCDMSVVSARITAAMVDRSR